MDQNVPLLGEQIQLQIIQIRNALLLKLVLEAFENLDPCLRERIKELDNISNASDVLLSL